MRKWHRWLALFAGIFLVWIAATGLVGQVISLAGGEHHDGPPTTTAPNHIKSDITSLDTQQQAKKEQKGPPDDLYHFVIDLHSGNYFGFYGKTISAIFGAVLFFFALSGMWMYFDMFRKRKHIGRSRIFWK